MSYRIVNTYTKTTESPVNAFTAFPLLAPDENVTQEQITAFKNAHPIQYESRVVQDQFIINYTYNSEADYTAISNNSIVVGLIEKRRVWSELNKLTFESRVI